MDLKILMVTNLPMDHYAGTEKMVCKMFERWIKEGHQVWLLNLLVRQTAPPEERWSPPFSTYKDRIILQTIKELPKRFSLLVMRWQYEIRKKVDYGTKEICKILEEYEDFDILIIDHYIWLSGAKKALNLCCSKAKIIFWNHGSISDIDRSSSIRERVRNFLAKPLLICWLKDVDFIVAISQGLGKIIQKYNSKVKIEVIYNPIGSLPGRLINSSAKAKFIFVGRLDEYSKNLLFLFRVLKELESKEWQLDIIGDGPDFKRYRNYIKKNGLSRCVSLLGFKENPFDDIAEATCLLLTSSYEGFPLVLVEAIEHGLPVISANCSTGPSEIVIPGINGFLYEPGNDKQLFALLKDVIDGRIIFPDKEIIAKTVHRFQQEKVFIQIENFLLNVIKKTE